MTRQDDRTGSCVAAVGQRRGVRAVVAIPVRNEAERIGACPVALATQQSIGASGLGAVLFLNNRTEGAAHVVAALHGHLPIGFA